ncbi:MAG: hypothetical protein QW542_05735, partial [Thermoproteota archaeon]
MNDPVRKTVFMTGLILLLLGAVAAIMAPADYGWRLRSQILVDGETVSVSAGWKTGSVKLVEELLRVE